MVIVTVFSLNLDQIYSSLNVLRTVYLTQVTYGG